MAQSDFEAHCVDLTDPKAIQQAFEGIERSHGRVDILVNNAGTCFMSEFPDIPAAEFDQQMSVNFSSAFHCCQAAIKLIARAGRDAQDHQYLVEWGV